MTTATVHLDQVAQRIAQQEAELEALRREYAARKNQLGELTRRQQTLQAQLNQVESQIQALTLGSAPAATAPAKPSPEAKPRKVVTYATLPDLILPLLRDAQGEPLTTRQLTDAVMRLGFSTTSRNPYGVVKSRANELVKKGILRRAPTGAGYLLAQTRSEPVASVRTSPSTQAKPMVARKVLPTKPQRSAGTASSPKASLTGAPKEQSSLRDVLLQVLRTSKRSMSARELGQQVLARGYRTGSKDFTHVVWVALGKMKEVERAPQGGYRLKNSKP